ncbi:LysR substrate-binding domain-containing protein [Paraburkholderia sp. ZP32-5]|uniref:LysR substrate-binding domain-containing protein n=1 Tax=Paraburkholderia sp. ZP32-5 TaxID=2883245 RepID=UPI001F24AFD7|nr:LysR substrate-binding domain-containing protein [Paraburkholderia sp. ZP32-5]
MNPLRSRLKIRHIQVTLAIANMGNLLRAAQSLNITQPAISKALAEVEEVIGERLFDRTPFGTKPTPAGEALIQYGRNVLTDMDRMYDALEAVRRGEAGTLRVGVFSLIAQWEPITRALIRLRDASRGLSLVIEDGNMEDLVPKLEAGSLDVIVGRYPYASQQQHHTVRGLGPDGIVAVVRTGHPVLKIESPDLASLMAYTWILPPERNIVRMQLEMEIAAARLSLTATPMTSLAMPVNVRLVQSTDCIMLMPHCVAREETRARRLAIVPVDLPVSVGPLIAMWRSERVIDRLRDTFVDLLVDETAASAPEPAE